MSRRKQAKPRAVLKHGSEEEVQQDAAAGFAGGEEAKDEATASDVESGAEDDDEEDEQPVDGENNTTNRRKITENLQEEGKTNDKAQYNDDPDDDVLEPAPDTFEDPENETSSDTFYSDLYSTHTSSSYSPSMSEGAATPNSLIHHHHHHHHPTEGDGNRLRGSHRRRSTSGANGSADGNDDDEEVDSGDDERVATSHEATEDGTDELSNVGDGDGKVPAKMRKIDRDATKSEKMTGDGIKTTSDGSYQCQFCDKSFPRLGYLKKHEQSHAEHLPFKCEYCARLFKHKRSRDRHTKLHTGDRRYRCPHCEAAFSRSDHLKIHMKTHDNQKPFQCTVCNRGYNTAAALTSHMQNHKKQAALLGGGAHALNFSPRSTGSGSSNSSFHKRRYATADNSPNRADYRKHVRGSYISCIYCTKSDFVSLDQLNTHIQTMHENATPKDNNHHALASHSVFQLSCEYCTMKFPNIPAMFQHMRATHIDRLASPNSYFEHFNRLAASGTFSPRLATSVRLDEMKVKTEEPSPKQERSAEVEKDEEQVGPTDLSQPKKRSQTPQSQGATSVDKPGAFLCNQCNAGLPDFETFRSHLKTHINQGVTNFVCHHCGLSLRDQAEYERHIVSHFLISSSEYACASSCSKVFPKPDDLQKHLFESHIQAMFKCSLCSDLFDSKVAIQVHFACAHSNENKIFRCSACMESFRAEKDFTTHIRTRHASTGSIQCMFCRAVCSSELEMHFHLAAHARQFRCPSCPETFHVEFLLDRHMQTHHAQKDGSPVAPPVTNTSNQLFQGQFTKTSNNNNNILDYHSFAATNKGLFPLPTNKFYNPLQVETNSLNSSSKHPSLMYGLGQRYFDTNKTLLDMYNYQQEKSGPNYFVSPSGFEGTRGPKAQPEVKTPDRTHNSGFSCGICERSDFRTEAEVHSHRKIVHNLKTGVSLRCAYCSGNFKSRSELEHHMKTCHNSTGKHKCLICDEIFPSPAILAEHKLQHSKVGQSGKCSHCSAALNDVAAFKSHLSEHNVEGQIPVQCICCRQTLNSDFEIGLHAKFHTKSSGTPENLCALCLEAIPPSSEARVCEKCCRKHNLTSKFNMRFETSRTYVENRCNLCKMILPHAQRLQEHLIEHTFVGCEERGYSCYICSAVFTVPAGLLSHMNEHGPNARPYDCNLCSEKYFFRAELDNHLIEHENRVKTDLKHETQQEQQLPKESTVSVQSAVSHEKGSEQKESKKEVTEEPHPEVKTEVAENEKEEEDEEEYIEVEKIAEASALPEINQNHQHDD